MAELVEDQHEEDADGIGDQQLQHQQGGADELVEVRFIDVPQQKQRGVLHKTQHVVHGHAIPVLGLIDEVRVTELHLHSWPAEHVDAGVEEGEQAKHDGGSHPGQSLFYVLRERRVAQPEQDPGVEEEHQEVQQNHRQHPELQHRAEQNQDHHTCGDLKASPQENAQVRRGPDVHFIVVVFDLNGQDVAAQRSVHNGQEGDHHQCAWHWNTEGERYEDTITYWLIVFTVHPLESRSTSSKYKAARNPKYMTNNTEFTNVLLKSLKILLQNSSMV